MLADIAAYDTNFSIRICELILASAPILPVSYVNVTSQYMLSSQLHELETAEPDKFEFDTLYSILLNEPLGVINLIVAVDIFYSLINKL
jgi:hypothetical protein|tara:strand:+ start:472 stop:738 length:267 start_codon:yes stop_codon:yes gene_type:complete